MRKNIVITGASAGLGMGMAREYAAKGHDLALCARRTEPLDRLRDELTARHPRINVVTRRLDVNDHDDVFAAFRDFRDRLGSLDRVIVNAGLGKGKPLGTGYFQANRQTAETNFVAALAQVEAAMEVFREQRAGHLVLISSMSAWRGMPRNVTTYAATKAGLAALGEGVRAETLRGPLRRVKVSTIYPGYIRTEMNVKAGGGFMVAPLEKGCRSLVRAIDREPVRACVPPWPWSAFSVLMRFLPLRVLARLM
ncbi:SDR family oxidoreductase [Saccharopolyspora erythraea]|uniref:SDR family oxidoreductase n=1 Tax=Saccharopolyspora erythraea TaxID=1836 RepID=UPI001BAABE4E|nr:SDR family oxidoreductase [Saccharopolyspora erythraea]QUH03157.1 SDR family oxidoreductase [Saccharopolyspora erythraea]